MKYNQILQIILTLFDPELQFIKTKAEIKDKLKVLLNELRKFKVGTVLVLDYKKRNDSQIFHSCTKLIASDLGHDKAFKSMYQINITKIKHAYENWIILDSVIKHSIKILSVIIRRKSGIINNFIETKSFAYREFSFSL